MPDLSLIKLGETVRSLRKANGFSQEKLAELTGLHRTYIGGVERGERNVSFLNLLCLAKSLDVSLATFMKDVE